jgi:hypothetical protein
MQKPSQTRGLYRRTCPRYPNRPSSRASCRVGDTLGGQCPVGFTTGRLATPRGTLIDYCVEFRTASPGYHSKLSEFNGRSDRVKEKAVANVRRRPSDGRQPGSMIVT